MKKIGLLCLAVILALGTLGVGYSLWSEDLYIEGYIETGELSAEWSIYDAWAEDPKGSSWIDAYILGDTLYVDIYNAYPSIWYYVWFDIHNDGTIPLHVGDFTVDPGNLPAQTDFSIDYYGPWQLHPSESGDGELWLHLANDAAENAVYTFSAQVTVGQWNEFPMGGP